MLFTPMGVGDAATRDSVETIARRWWLPLLTGILTVAAGIVLLAVDWTAKGLAWMVGAIFIYRGLSRALTPSFSSSARGFNVVTAIASVLAGVAFVVWPEPTLLVLAVFIGSYLLVDGILHLLGAIEMRHDIDLWWLELLFGAGLAVLGFLALRRPEATLTALVLLAGLWAVVVGTAEILAAFVVRSAPRALATAGGRAAHARIDETITLAAMAPNPDEQLHMLNRLRLSGALTDAEYDRVRNRLTGQPV
jgi:uncharacterized membrane protein HdeD (DUF308 family)